ncbi:hypothetical protein KIH27_18635 [Mycobacterium sp. M1]|uniref:Uncharacterized protein n=1 Tax=Mycolicibacter acidiphilus TaxID=2835306 RepID=A0ABS5RMR7_9MYCO|nr:hypothetical protein [Mycolicibacter acidiphilus]MBS9535607.1 hypothetical protein [Mycolicibacter acidiphilus]
MAVSEMVRQAAETVYRKYIGMPAEWTPQQQDQFLDLKTAHIDDQAWEIAMATRETAVQNWPAHHNGQLPDYLETVGLWESAIQNARSDLIRSELYDTIPEPELGELPTPSEATPPVVTGIPWTDRWRHLRYRTIEPTDEMDDLVDQVWPPEQFSTMFRVVAAILVAHRWQEGLAVPDSPRHLLAETLIDQINADLTTMGYPPEGR